MTTSKDQLALLRKFRQQRRPEAAAGQEAIPAADRSRPLPASFGQEQLWLLDRLEPGTSVFNMLDAKRLRGALDAGALRDALAEVVRRHEALRTTFTLHDGEVTQSIAPPGAFELCTVDLSALPGEERRRRLDEEVTAESATPFDLERGPLYRATLLRLEASEHLLLLNLHHVVSDGWSFGVLFEELAALYGAAVAGRPLAGELAPLPIQYADFAAWQRARLTPERQEEQWSYWREQLAGAPAELELPTDYRRAATASHRGGHVVHRLPAALTAALGDLARQEKVSLFVTLLSAFKLLLHRYTGQDEIVVGAPSAGRDRGETHALIGFFLNTLVLRTRIGREDTFLEWLRRVRTTALGAFAHQDVPFDRILAELQPERHLSRTPLFQVMFNMVNLPGSPETRWPGLEIEDYLLPRVESKFDFTWYVTEAGGEVRIDLIYDADLFRAERMEEMLAQYARLLEQAVADPGRRIHAFSLRTASSEPVLPRPTEELDGTWRGSLPDTFSHQAARFPDKAAVTDPDSTWTYRELERRSHRLAHHLRRHGVGTGETVAIYAQRSASLVWAILGTLKAGAAFVLLDPAYPAARLAEYVRQAGARAWLEVEGAGEPPEELGTALGGVACRLRLPRSAAAAGFLAEESDDDPAVPLGPDDLAYVAFTSGSTGEPKGILGRHGSLTHFLPWLAETFGFSEDDRHALLSALSHDPLQRDVLYPLAYGATLAVPDPELLFSPGYLGRFLAAEGVTVVNLVPAMLQLLTADGRELPRLSRAFIVGDVLTHDHVAALYALAPAAVCVNLYGSTETQRSVSFHVAPREACETAGPPRKAVLPLGRGYPGVQLLVRNPAGEMAGVGELGEIYFRSRHMARGYLDAELTRERFLTNPFTGEDGDRLYRTGDLGRYLPDGGVEFAGRADHQVKVRGFRIELGEVEAVLARHPAVGSCAVTVHGDAADERRLVAYVVGDETPAAEALREHLGARLPEYMVPSAFVVLEALPLSPTGKVDRKALPAPPQPGGEARTAPRTPEEETVAAIWSEVLSLREVDAHESFFALGGHSLLAMQVLTRLRDAFGCEVTLRQFFEAPTVAGLAATLESAERARDGLEAPPLRPRAADAEPLPLSFAQQRIWFLEQLIPDSAAFVLAGALRLRGQLDAGALERSLTEIVRRHEVLRTSFPNDGGKARQRIRPPAPHALERLDLRGLPPAERQRELDRRTAHEAGRPFDVENGPLLRTLLILLDDAPGREEHVLVYCFHHLVFDGWSFRVFLGELMTLYEASSPLEELPLQYADFAVWERDYLRGAALERQLAWWRGHLEGAPPRTELPTDRPHPVEQTFRGDRRHFEASPESSHALRELARRRGATPFMVTLAAFKALLRRITHQDDLVVGTPIARRTHSELESLIGFFANTLALRTRVTAETSFGELLRCVREATLGASAHQEIPFEKLVDELGVERDLSQSPIFQVMFGLQSATPGAVPCGDGLTLEALPVEVHRSPFELSLSLVDDGERYRGWLEFNVDLFDAATAERLLRAYERLLPDAVAAPETPVGKLALLGEAERRQLLDAWSHRAAGVPALLPELFAAQLERAPGETAVEFDGVTYTYRELDELSNRLARHLRARGAGAEVRVGVLLERSAELVTALLAVLKSGAAYVPLDPIYPRERLELMLHDSGAKLLLTQGDLAQGLGLPEGLCVVRLEEEKDAVDARPGRAPAPALTASSLAYVLYTSGSTGKPKGVQISHGALANFLVSMAERPGFEAGDTLLALTTVCFDIAVLELFLPLVRGGRVVVASRETASDGLRLAETVETSRATVVQATPATWRMLVEAGWEPSRRLKVLCGGEALPADLAAALLRRQVELWNVYGPTETTVWSTVRPIETPFAQGNARIGRPIRNTSIELTDPALRTVPVGVTGELLIGGDGLARGYWNRPALTAERFVPAAAGRRPGERLYRTGDLARWTAGGDLEILGRIDHQVKLRGFRIELGEIEAALVAHPAVAQGAVVLHGSDGRQRLVAYAAPRPGHAAPPPEELRRSLETTLPDYMVPTAYVFLEALPLTKNGKVDRRSLPEPGDEALPATPYVAPSTAAEEALAAVWCEVLNVERVGVYDNFFALGGDSILAIQVVTQARQARLVIAPRHLFQHQELGSLAAVAVEVPTTEQAPGEKRYEADVSGTATDTGLLDADELEDVFADLEMR